MGAVLWTIAIVAGVLLGAAFSIHIVEWRAARRQRQYEYIKAYLYGLIKRDVQ